MTKRKLSEETNNLKLPDLNTFNIFKVVSETPDYTYFVLNHSPYAKTLFLRKFISSFIEAILAATNNLYLMAK